MQRASGTVHDTNPHDPYADGPAPAPTADDRARELPNGDTAVTECQRARAPEVSGPLALVVWRLDLNAGPLPAARVADYAGLLLRLQADACLLLGVAERVPVTTRTLGPDGLEVYSVEATTGAEQVERLLGRLREDDPAGDWQVAYPLDPQAEDERRWVRYGLTTALMVRGGARANGRPSVSFAVPPAAARGPSSLKLGVPAHWVQFRLSIQGWEADPAGDASERPLDWELVVGAPVSTCAAEEPEPPAEPLPRGALLAFSTWGDLGAEEAAFKAFLSEVDADDALEALKLPDASAVRRSPWGELAARYAGRDLPQPDLLPATEQEDVMCWDMLIDDVPPEQPPEDWTHVQGSLHLGVVLRADPTADGEVVLHERRVLDLLRAVMAPEGDERPEAGALAEAFAREQGDPDRPPAADLDAKLRWLAAVCPDWPLLVKVAARRT